ncbi:MAG: hypothetical protein PHT78_13245, partial [Desulfitobacteriaceae bacterium]|nr:hypothetical protein [Desulfitobacteriaceae bacterium]
SNPSCSVNYLFSDSFSHPLSGCLSILTNLLYSVNCLFPGSFTHPFLGCLSILTSLLCSVNLNIARVLTIKNAPITVRFLLL